jgi:hypothetical protein
VLVHWRAEEEKGRPFFKVIRCKAYPPPFFTNLFAVNAALKAAWVDASDPPPPSLVLAELLFGMYEVCLTMQWVSGRDASGDDLAENGCAVIPVAEAIAWLARHGLLYTDLRAPNVRISPSGDVVLVDYDDLVICDPPLAAGAPFVALAERFSTLGDAVWMRQGCGNLPAVWSKLEQVWERRRTGDGGQPGRPS